MDDNNEVLETKKEDHKKPFIFLYVISIIAFNITLFYFFLPVIYGLFSVLVLFIAIIIIAVPAVFTFFLIVLDDRFRHWVGQVWSTADKIAKINDKIPMIAPYFNFVIWPSLILMVLVVTLGFVRRFKNNGGYLSFIITSIIFTMILVGIAVAYYLYGQTLGLTKA